MSVDYYQNRENATRNYLATIFSSGPRAFLPLFDNWACLIWYGKPARIRSLLNLSLEQLKQEIIHAFPDRLGIFQVIAKGSFPLIRYHANHYVEDGLILVGDTAHSINSLAARGQSRLP